MRYCSNNRLIIRRQIRYNKPCFGSSETPSRRLPVPTLEYFMSNLKFYPTPSTLAYKAYNKFKNKSVTRLLEPSAVRGDLLAPFLASRRYSYEKMDCIEVNLNNQAILRQKDFTVIDADFMQFDDAPMYSHIVMNPRLLRVPNMSLRILIYSLMVSW